MNNNQNKYLKNSAFILFGLFPFHTFIVYIASGVTGLHINDPKFIIFKMWKESFIATVILVYILNKIILKKSFTRFDSLDFIIAAFCFLGIIYIAISDRIYLSVWSFRTIYSCFLFYFFGRIQIFNQCDFIKLIKMMFIIGIVISIFGVLQVEILGPTFFEKFYDMDQTIASTAYMYNKMRAQSTFVTPNELGLFLVLILFSVPLLISQMKQNRSTEKYIVFIGTIIIGTGLIYSFSRSSILLLLFGYGIVSIYRKFYLVFLIILCGVLLVALQSIGALDNILSVLNSYDPSTLGHLYVIDNAIDIAIREPMGIGLGTVGVVIRRFIFSAPQFEGEFFNILVQMGVISIFLYLFVYFDSFVKLIKKILNKDYSMLDKHIFIYISIVAIGLLLRDLFLPRDGMNYSYGWFLIGASTSFIKTKKD